MRTCPSCRRNLGKKLTLRGGYEYKLFLPGRIFGLEKPVFLREEENTGDEGG